MITARYVRTVAAISLVLNAVLSVVSIALMPAFAQGTAENLAAIDAAGTMATISATAFVVAQLPFIIAVLGISHLAGIRAPIIAVIAGTVAVIGGFGHAVFGGTQLVQLAMAADTANHTVYAGLLDGEMPLPLMIMMLCGTVGTVLGMLLLGVAVLRAKVGPRWVPYAIWLWLVIEFVGTSITEWATLASGLLYLGTLGALAVAVWRSPLTVWASAATTAADAARKSEALSA
ncbi:hypothetical protein ACX3O0_11605 [Homoserinimonas sp. A447]